MKKIIVLTVLAIASQAVAVFARRTDGIFEGSSRTASAASAA